MSADDTVSPWARPRPAPTPLHPALVTSLDISAVLVTVSLTVLVALGVTGGARLALALAFVTFVPGWALLDHVALVAGGTSRLALAVAVSLTIAAIAASGLLWLHLWHPFALLDSLGLLSVVALAAHLAGAGRTPWVPFRRSHPIPDRPER